jgi:hypothetical protein
MYGPYIEQQFSHIEFENEQLKRKLETRRWFEAEPQHKQERTRRSLVSIFGRFIPRLDVRTPASRSPEVPC